MIIVFCLIDSCKKFEMILKKSRLKYILIIKINKKYAFYIYLKFLILKFIIDYSNLNKLYLINN